MICFANSQSEISAITNFTSSFSFLSRSRFWPMISFRLAGRRTFYIEDDRRTRIDIFSRDKSAGLDQHFVAAVAKLGDEWKNILLRQRLAAGHLNQLAAKLVELCKDILERYPLAAVERILAVAPNAPHRTAGQPHKRARPSGVRRLALNREKYLCNSEVHSKQTEPAVIIKYLTDAK